MRKSLGVCLHHGDLQQSTLYRESLYQVHLILCQPHDPSSWNETKVCTAVWGLATRREQDLAQQSAEFVPHVDPVKAARVHVAVSVKLDAVWRAGVGERKESSVGELGSGNCRIGGGRREDDIVCIAEQRVSCELLRTVAGHCLLTLSLEGDH
jgi:hypothetical protein